MLASLCTFALAPIAFLAPIEDPPAVVVRNAAELRAAARTAGAGTRILVAPGIHEGGFQFANLRGSAEKPLLIAALDPAHPPIIRGGTSGIQLSDAEHVELRDLVFEAQTGNGINVDDGGRPQSPARNVVLRGLTLRDVGPKGNCDGIKLSGVDSFLIEDCTVERWGSGGSAVDMVGCRRGTIRDCVFRGAPDAANASGVQTKGGSREIAIRRCRFEHAGARGVNIGGSTGLEYFRPPLAQWTGPRFEAAQIVVEGNTFIGSEAPIAFVGVDRATVRFNTIYVPGRWAVRILQETREDGFVPCRGGVFSDNLVVFRSDRWSEGGVNCGTGTEPGSFRFERNLWTCLDEPARSRELLRLPAEERDGAYGVEPMFKDAANGDLGLRQGSPAAKVGADAFVE